MGKVDDLRALREARYNEARARLGTPTRSIPRKQSQTAAAPAPGVTVEYPEVVLPEAFPETTGELCGHRAISGKTCIRPLNHTEKNHRYGKEARDGR